MFKVIDKKFRVAWGLNDEKAANIKQMFYVACILYNYILFGTCWIFLNMSLGSTMLSSNKPIEVIHIQNFDNQWICN